MLKIGQAFHSWLEMCHGKGRDTISKNAPHLQHVNAVTDSNLRYKQCKQESLVNWKALEEASVKSTFPRAGLSSKHSSPLKSKGSVFHSWGSYEWAYAASREHHNTGVLVSFPGDLIKANWGSKGLSDSQFQLTIHHCWEGRWKGPEAGPSHSYSGAESKKACMLVLSL